MERSDEEIRRSIEQRTVLPASFSDEDRRVAQNRLINSTTLRETLSRTVSDIWYSEIVLTPEQKTLVTNYLEVAKNKLLSLGIPESENLLPFPEQIAFYHSKELEPHGSITSDGTFIVIVIPDKMSINDLLVRKVFFHEIAHFITKSFFNIHPYFENFGRTQLGYNRSFNVPKKRGKGSKTPLPREYFKGIYEEPTADLFSLSCLNDETSVYRTPYLRMDAFLITMLEEFARKKNISPLEAFKKLFQAKVRGDFKFQKEMVEVFGAKAVRGFNNIVTWSRFGKRSGINKYHQYAEAGGFGERFAELLSAIKTGNSIKFNGIGGELRPLSKSNFV